MQELLHTRHLSQEQLAQTLSVKQAAVSKLEKRTDMYISILRIFIKAMGGDREITAKFPDGSVQISQFEDIASKTGRGSLPSSGCNMALLEVAYYDDRGYLYLLKLHNLEAVKFMQALSWKSLYFI